MALLAVALLALNIKSTQIIPIISSAAIATAQIAYLFVTVPLPRARLKGTWPPKPASGRRFSLGRLGLPINILAVVWGIASALNLLWPRKSLFNPVPPFHWYFQYGPILYIGIAGRGGHPLLPALGPVQPSGSSRALRVHLMRADEVPARGVQEQYAERVTGHNIAVQDVLDREAGSERQFRRGARAAR